MTASTVETEPDTAGPRLNQPRRAFAAVGEVVLAVLLVALAVWCWQRGILRYGYPVPDGPPLESTRMKGNWVGAAAGLVLVAGVLLLDAVRQTVLAVRTRAPERDGRAPGDRDHDGWEQGAERDV
ncbi:hypothetical protein [Saccharothrix yanglingensis]|uniref:Integral membrane protein n=1 Tax=Saccharothrix yanglingensis TaxID=659496 RepID=A0ABU0WS71_9PSEU|nr:hypothetical protein [Saccharothrix yanglingensis]MDQ2582686.1 hypothetical protein [Saccharothrix yanglingensis]